MKLNQKLELSQEIYEKFALYYLHNAAWGVFHVALGDGNYNFDVNMTQTTEQEKELIEIFNRLSYSQRKKLAKKAETIVTEKYNNEFIY